MCPGIPQKLARANQGTVGPLLGGYPYNPCPLSSPHPQDTAPPLRAADQKGDPSVANGEESVGRTQGLRPAYSTYLASRALRSRVDARSYILGAKHWARHPLQPGEYGPLLTDEEASPERLSD